MRNMIKKKYACILLLLLAIGSGCSDWLDVRPRNEMKEEDMYANDVYSRNVGTTLDYFN